MKRRSSLFYEVFSLYAVLFRRSWRLDDSKGGTLRAGGLIRSGAHVDPSEEVRSREHGHDRLGRVQSHFRSHHEGNVLVKGLSALQHSNRGTGNRIVRGGNTVSRERNVARGKCGTINRQKVGDRSCQAAFRCAQAASVAKDSGSCSHFWFPAGDNPSAGQLPDLDGSSSAGAGADECGDLHAQIEYTVPLLNPIPVVEVPCLGSGGYVELDYCVAWKVPGQDTECFYGGNTDVYEYRIGTVPGTKSKCTCEKVTTNIEITQGGGVSGDPHVRRWGRKSFDFHGECDLVFVHSDHVNGDKTLDVHVRTTVARHWSQIESAAMKIGDITLQMDTDKFFIDGKEYSDADLPIETAEFTVTEPVISESVRDYVIELTDKSTITFKVIEDFMNVFVAGSQHDFGESVGLLGDFKLGKPYNRAGKRMFDLQEFAFEWQVNHEVDPLLFNEQREPQLPLQKCRMPDEAAPSRRLRTKKDPSLFAAAKAACANTDEIDACIDDVMFTGVVALAKAW